MTEGNTRCNTCFSVYNTNLDSCPECGATNLLKDSTPMGESTKLGSMDNSNDSELTVKKSDLKSHSMNFDPAQAALDDSNQLSSPKDPNLEASGVGPATDLSANNPINQQMQPGQFGNYYPNPGQQNTPYQMNNPQVVVYNQIPHTTTNPLAIASLVVSFLWFIYGLGSVLAIIFGHIALYQIKKGQRGRDIWQNGPKYEGGKGLAIAGLILGYIGVVVWVIIIIFIVILAHKTNNYGSYGNT